MMQSFPWAELMRHGMGRLHLSPHDFWTATLRELVPLRGQNVPSRTELEDLMKEWPDE